jgi:hypothetical protein
MTKIIKVLEKVKLQGQRSDGQGHGIKWKVLHEGIQLCTYESNVMTKVKVLEKQFKLQGQRSEDHGHGIKWKGLPERI